MKNLLFIFGLLFVSFGSASAQDTYITIGSDLGYFDPDGVAPIFYVQVQKKLKSKFYYDIESQFIYSSENIPAFRSQANKPIAAGIFEEDYPFSSPDMERWFDKGFKVMKSKAKKTFYFTTDIDFKYSIMKNDKNEIGISSGVTIAYVERQDASLIIPGQFESIDFEKKDIVLPVMFYIRYFDFGGNIKLNYTRYLNEHSGIGIKAGFHKLGSSHYTSLGLYYNVRF